MIYVIKDKPKYYKKNMELCLCTKAVGTKIITVLPCHQKAEQNLNINVVDTAIGNVTSRESAKSKLRE
jgi:hypothetical protein